MKHAFASHSGSVLVVVLWLLVLLTVLGASFSITVHQQSVQSLHQKERLQGYLAARGAVLQVLADLAQVVRVPFPPPESEEASGRCYAWGEPGPMCGREAGAAYRIILEDATVGVNLNAEDDTLLDLLLQKVGLDAQHRAMIRDSIKDWRDEDDLRRLNGAEEEDYQALEKPYHCKNGDFDSVEELVWVRGVDRGIVYGGERDGRFMPGIAPFLTVADYRTKEEANKALKSRVNLNAGPVEMLEIFPGVTRQMVTELKTIRRERGRLTSTDVAQVLGGDVYAVAAPYLSWDVPSVIRVTALGYAGDDLPSAAVQCVARVNKADGRVEVLEWVDALDWRRYVTAGDLERDADQ